MSKFHSHNIAVVTLGLKQFTKEVATREVMTRLRRIASSIVDYIDAHFKFEDPQFPEYTANMHDATGVAIYNDGVLESYTPIQRASVAQKTAIDEDEWGYQELANAIRVGATKYSKGIWLVLFCASSYAEKVEDIGSPANRGQGFFTWLWDIISIDIKKAFNDCIIAPMFGLSDSIPF